MIETIKSLATPSRRSRWCVKFHDQEETDTESSYYYTDEKLEELRE
jgi:hypothetical protein